MTENEILLALLLAFSIGMVITLMFINNISETLNQEDDDSESK